MSLRQTKPYDEMTTGELARATRPFDREDLSPEVPLRGEKLARYERARAKQRARSTAGKSVSITLTLALLLRVDREARRHKLTRSQWIEQTLRARLANGSRRHRTRRAG
jgi:hypothetical protein